MRTGEDARLDEQSVFGCAKNMITAGRVWQWAGTPGSGGTGRAADNGQGVSAGPDLGPVLQISGRDS